MGFFPQTPSCTNLFCVDAPYPLTGHSYLLHYRHVFGITRGLTFVQRVLLPSTNCSDCLCSRVCRFMRRRPIPLPPLHKVSKGLPSYILRTGSSRMDGRDVYGVIRCVPSIVVFGVGTLLPRRPVMSRRPNAGAGGGCCLFPLKLVCVRVG